MRRQMSDRHDSLRVAVVTESFLPSVNGVTNSVLRVINHLRSHGHQPVVIAPGPGATEVDGIPVIRLKSVDLPRYDDVRIALPRYRLSSILREVRPDVVHVAAPVVLGAAALRCARRLDIPTVAVFQTDIAGFARRHGLTRLSEPIWAYLSRVHQLADVTLAPSRVSAWPLMTRGCSSVEIWPRGVDLEQFQPSRRSETLRRFLAPAGQPIVGFVGRLAREKQVERLAPLAESDAVRLVIVGDGPERGRLERAMPRARFAGFQQGTELAKFHASLDIFVHTGLDETFCQTVQEAMASGVPVVGPSSGGPLELIRHGVNGYFWSPEVPDTLEGAVLDLAGDAARRRRFGLQGRRDAEQRPWSVILDRLVDTYRDTIAGRATRHRLRRWVA
ncbi:MAG: glycosyltransferase family 4 protein [Ilumatobacteraceae bacterium]